ncbi:ABC transporter ATP-binding protein [Risungbinella massiliensis]|uniref:ABC transporter ATP-binding protein n=1 Tax=Risungbinella massiliensis TaxID=1329796 RepID=UPI0005CBC92A|nr:ATP-binding cassette domain-containing protein [Risungbinella massiliensis]
MIQLQNVTRKFPNGKGIFEVSLEVQQGEVFGFIGPNGAGKSTTIRHLMGFMKPDSGTSSIRGLDSWKDSTEVKKYVGYLPGEIAFIEGMTGKNFLDLLEGMRGQKDLARKNRLLEHLELDPTSPIRMMSKGMKQKLGLVAAFMHDPEIYILDEPTSGLDPLIQQRFIELILEEKQRGKTIFMSSHMFREMEKTCDRAAMMKDGRIIAENDMETFQREKKQQFQVTVRTKEDVQKLLEHPFVRLVNEDTVEFQVDQQVNKMIAILHEVDVVNLRSVEEDLENLFLHYYQKEDSK